MLRGISLKFPGRDEKEERPACIAHCDHEVYRGEFIAEWEGRMLCPDCWKAAVAAALDKYPLQLALEMQLRVETFE